MATEDQKKAIESRRKKVIVTASAGAGKTSTMVDRVIALITKDRVPLSSIVMLTFTEAAAEEMRSRLADALLSAIKAAKGETRDALVEALDQLPLLYCSTIDSFCYRIVKSHFEYLGLSPRHALMDETVADSYREKAVKEVLDEFAEEALEKEGETRDRYYRFLASFGKEEEDALKEYVKKLYNYAETTEDGDAFLVRAEELAALPVEEHPAILEYVASLGESTRRALREIEELGIVLPDEAKNYRKRYAFYINTLNDFLACDSLRDFAERATGMGTLPGRIGNDAEKFAHLSLVMEKASDIFKEWREEIFRIKEEGKPLLKMGYDALVDEIRKAQEETAVLVELTRRFKKRYRAIKEEEKALDFSDVEHGAFLLLRDHAIGKEIDCKHLLVDECQDLNPLQDALMRLLVGDENLFIVGDVKQSIYRFRLSDPELFHKRVESGVLDKESSEVIGFNENFRSSDAVIAFVNTLFSHLMKKEFGGMDYLPATRGERHFGSGLVRSFFYSKPLNKPLREEVYSVKKESDRIEKEESFSVEGAWIRDRISELVRPSPNETILRDTKNDEPFALSYKDIAILSPGGMKPGKVQEKIVNALREAGIPVNVGDFVKDAEHPEISAVVDFLRLLESPHNDYALLSVLRSDLFSFSAERIAEIALGEGDSFWSKAEAAAEKNADLKEVYDYLEKMRFLSSSLTLFDLVSLLIEERLRLSVLRRPDGRKIFGELLRFAETLKEGKATSSISEYLPYFDKYFTMSIDGEVSERDAVNVMTIHKSKGMQFPIVFVVGLGDQIVNGMENQEKVRMDKELGVIKKGRVKNLLFELLRLKKVRELKEDKLRLLYVALTRAKNYLFLSGEVSAGKEFVSKERAEKLSQWIIAGMQGVYTFENEYAPAFSVTSKTKSAESSLARCALPSQGDVAALADAFLYQYPHKEATKTGIKYTVTSINAMEEEDYCPPTLLFPEEKKAKGTAFHAVMEHLPFTIGSVEETQAFLLKLCEEGMITPEERRDLSPRKVYQAAECVRALVGDRRVLREKSFLLHVPAREVGVAAIDDEVEVQGKIDLLALGEKDAVIVDYKLSGLPREVLIERYRAQLELYALAVKKGFGLERIRSYIFVLGRNETIEL